MKERKMITLPADENAMPLHTCEVSYMYVRGCLRVLPTSQEPPRPHCLPLTPRLF